MNVVRVPAVFTIIWHRNFHKKVHQFSMFIVSGRCDFLISEIDALILDMYFNSFITKVVFAMAFEIEKQLYIIICDFG